MKSVLACTLAVVVRARPPASRTRPGSPAARPFWSPLARSPQAAASWSAPPADGYLDVFDLPAGCSMAQWYLSHDAGKGRRLEGISVNAAASASLSSCEAAADALGGASAATYADTTTYGPVCIVLTGASCADATLVTGSGSTAFGTWSAGSTSFFTNAPGPQYGPPVGL